MGSSISGVLVVDKPRGPTSHDVVMRLRRALRTREVGHAGTLDPMASGVLVVAVGAATRLVPWLTAGDKAYEATVALGVETATLDALGAVTREVPPDEALGAALEAAARGELGPLLSDALAGERARTAQIPPAFSAIHVDGARAHALARAGVAVDLAPRAVAVLRLELLAARARPPALDLSLDVTKGYYVRALARDLAVGLGTVGHLTALRRTRSGPFTLADAAPLDAPDLVARLVPVAAAAARTLPALTLDDAGVRAARHGQRVPLGDAGATIAGPCAWLAEDGTLVAVGERADDGAGRVLRGFPAAIDGPP